VRNPVYAARGDVNSCGWLARAWRGAFHSDEGSFDLTRSRIARIGRFRMCAGLMLRRHALKVGPLSSAARNHGARREKARKKSEEGGSGGINPPVEVLQLFLF